MSRTLTFPFFPVVLIIISFEHRCAPLSLTFVSRRQRDTDDFDSLIRPEVSGIANHHPCSCFATVYFFSLFKALKILGGVEKIFVFASQSRLTV